MGALLLLCVYTLVAGAVLALLQSSWLEENVTHVARRLWAARRIPEPPGSLLLGHIPALVASRFTSFRLFHAWSLQCGPLYKVRFFLRPVIVVTDPELYGPLLLPGPGKLAKHLPPYRMFEVFTNPERSNILTSPEHETWRTVRRAAAAALTMNNLRLAFPGIIGVTQRFIDGLRAAGPAAVHDMDRAAAGITVDVIGLAAFHRDLQATAAASSSSSSGGSAATPAAAEEGQQQQAPPGIGGSVAFGRGAEVLDVISHLVVAMQARNNPLNRWFPWRKAHRDLFCYGERMSNLVRALAASMEATPPPAHTLGAHLLGAKYSTGQPLDRNQVLAEIGILWGAGFETTAHTICWALFLLATHPEAEQRLCAELDDLGLLASPERPQPGALEWEHLSQLKFLSAVINESMRLFPVTSSGVIRVTHAPINLGGHHLPRGQPILVPMWAVHRSPRLWPAPDEFRPERFLQPAGGSATAEPAGDAAPAPPASSAASSVGGDSDYVDVAADIASWRDQEGGGQQAPAAGSGKGGGGAGSGSKGGGADGGSSSRAAALDVKDVAGGDRRGFFPFSLGSRNCVGQALALVELKAVLALLLGNFSFELTPEMGGFEGVSASARQTITLRPGAGLMMTLKHRSLQQAP